MKKKYWIVTVYDEETRLGRWMFDNLNHAMEKIVEICSKDEGTLSDMEFDRIQLETYYEKM